MRRGLILLAPMLIAIAAPARAAPLDMGGETCQDWLDASEDEQDAMVAWLRGFVAGKSGVTLYDLRASRADATTIKRYCQGHLTVSLVSAAGQFGR